MSFLQTGLAYVADKTNRNPEYIQLKQELNKFGDKLGIAGLASTVACVALGVLGLALCLSPAYPVGIVFIGLGALVFGAAYNSFSLSENLKSVAKNPLLYVNQLSLSPKLKSDNLKNQLAKNTFGIEWLINDLVDILDQDFRNS